MAIYEVRWTIKMMSGSDNKDATTVKPKRRRWWRGWWWKAPLSLILIVIATHAIWFFVARAAWHRELAELKAADEWVSVDDLNQQPRIVGPDYAEPVQSAAKKIQESREVSDYEFDDRERPYPLTPKAQSIFEKYVTAYEDALAEFDQASGRTSVDWKRTYKSPLIDQSFDDVDDVWHLALVASYDAMLAFDDGRHQHAFNRVEQLRELAEHNRAKVMGKDWITSIGIEALGLRVLDGAIPDLKIGDGENEIPRSSVEAMIDALLDESDLPQATRNMLRADRVFQIDAVESFVDRFPASSSLLKSIANYVVGPLKYGDMRLCSQAVTEKLKWCAIDNSADLDMAIANDPHARKFDSRLHGFARAYHDKPQILFELHYRYCANRLLVATALAVRLYQTDHQGHLPESLALLVPEYLSAIPRDPFTKSDVIRYIAHESEPRIYCIDLDREDDNGLQWPPTKRDKNADMVVYLKRQPTRTSD